MKRLSLFVCVAFSLITVASMAQKVKSAAVPAAVRTALAKKYLAAADVTWEKEKGNFEANWGGASKEDNSVIFASDGSFVEQVVAIPVTELPAGVAISEGYT